uniref:FAD-binding and (Fe-S)-binding domain-containing protein n=1 Tax=Thaumasiovibrio occultus TaxID=1891184 RepID=UPI000B357BB5|nr:FAD-binding and (Fe-S)-binding domain-containing protein [Thaumasiovibrio occultus]
MEARYARLRTILQEIIPTERIVSDPDLCFAYGTDASFYRLTPQLVVFAEDCHEVSFLMASCYQANIPFTFRAAGTSLSGQAISDSVLIMMADTWRDYHIEEEGAKITLQPGVVGAMANQYLQPYDRRIGPDPASINTCKIGGIAANNSSGMCCGTAQNTYHTVEGMTLILFDGDILDTRCKDSIAHFSHKHPWFIARLDQLAQQCRGNYALSEKIRHKYRLKNTTGYSLNALVDFEEPIDILQHLMVGSEGTLGFIADITYRTVADHANKATGLYVFDDIETTCNLVSALAKQEVAAVELMDSRALRSVQDKPGMPDFLATVGERSAALLIELHAASADELAQNQAIIEVVIAEFSPLHQVALTTDRTLAAQLWAVRKGTFPAVGAVRETGTTVIIEDVAFPVEHLAQAVVQLQQCFTQFHYHEAIIFGHALAGNLHFVFTQSFDSPEEVERYGAFMDAVCQLVAVDYGGSLKAEHGTGRNMAPFLELEWGPEGVALMHEIKRLFDPKGLMNPGVIVNDDPTAHLNDLKPMPAADPIIDKCIECGFCEPVCPARNLTLTPRQRNVLYRRLTAQRDIAPNSEETKALEKQFRYAGVDTCAATGLCADRCPVGIDTGALMKQLRQNHSERGELIATWTAEHFSTVTRSAKVGLGAADLIHRMVGSRLMSGAGKVGHLAGLPLWTSAMPTPSQSMSAPKITQLHAPKVVYFPSCASRNMGRARGSDEAVDLSQLTMSLLERAGFSVIIPDELSDKCCGMPFDSKGFPEQAAAKSRELEATLFAASEQGRWPILMDTSPCMRQSKLRWQDSPLTLYEPFSFVAEFVMPLLPIRHKVNHIMLHITCTSRRSGLAGVMEQVAKLCAEQVTIPEGIECCGFAGDKGFTLPELNQSALRNLRAQVPQECHGGYSNSRTCEIGLSHHSGIEYRSILYLIDEVTR